MPTVKVQAVKMKEGTAQFISMVERGANRIPFKIIKQEKDMAGHFASLDLANLFGTRKAEKPATPQVVAVVTMKGEGLESVKKQIESAGFAVADMQEMEDGSVVFKQDGDMEGDTTVVRLNDHVAVVTKGFRPYSMDMDVGNGTSFAEACAAQGFYPGVRTIVDVLSQSINAAVEKSETPADAAKAVSKMFDEAKAYTVSFMTSLPVKAFKLEAVAPEAAAKSEESEGGASSDDPDESPAEVTCKTCGGKKTGPDMALKEDGTPDEVCKACAPKAKKPKEDDQDGEEPDGMEDDSDESAKGKKAKKSDEGLTPEAVAGIVASQMGEVVASLTKKLDESLTAITKSVQESVSAVQGNVEALASRVEKAESEAEAAKSAVSGTVVPGSESGDHVPTQARKSESGSFGGREIDTAFMVGVRKRASR